MIDISLNNDIIVTDRLMAGIQVLDILFNTSPAEMIGNATYGVNFLQFLWQLTPNESTIERYIREKIQANTFYVKQLAYELSVKTDYLDSELYYIINITLTESYYNDGDGVSKQYIIKS
jgi:hypothetical protein